MKVKQFCLSDKQQYGFIYAQRKFEHFLNKLLQLNTQACLNRDLATREQNIKTVGKGNRPGLEIVYGILHSSLVVFAHVLVHVWVVGADILFCASVGHRAKLQRRVLLLWMLKLSQQRKAGEEEGRGMRHTRLCTNLSDLFLSTFQTNLQQSMHSQIFEQRAVSGLKEVFSNVFLSIWELW